MAMGNKVRLCLVSILVIGSWLIAACQPIRPVPAESAAPAPNAGQTAQTANPDAIFTVVQADGSAKAFALADLRALPMTSIMADGSPQEGPSLLAVLEAAGVSDFAEVTLTGIDGTKTLTHDEVTAEVVLDFNNRGSVKIVAPDWPRDARIRDITQIEVK